MKQRFWASLLILFTLLPAVVSAGVSARVDRPYAYEGESITLSIRAENVSGSGEPDFRPLAQDFHIGGTSQSSSISIINGRSSSSQTWSVRLRPLKMGKIEIPPIQVGNESTQALSIEIKPIPEITGSHKDQPLFLTLEVTSEAKQFYVQQHIPLVARLYYKHQIKDGRVSDPAAENVILERLGEDLRYRSKRNGQDYQVFERHYSLIAEKSGELTIPAVKFKGYMSTPGGRTQGPSRTDPFSQFFSTTPMMSKGQPVSVKSESIKLNILAHPNDYDGEQWLPAESLTLKDSWTAKPPNFKVGEPVNRTITIEAKGLVASQIKPLELPSVSSFRRYAEPAESLTRTDGQTVYASSRRSFTYIPAYEGEQEIPAIELHWWDVLNQKQQTASLPAWKIQVEAGLDNSPAPPTPAKPPAVMQSAPANQNNQKPNVSPTTPDTNNKVSDFLEMAKDYGWWLLGLFILILLLLLFGKKQRESENQRQQQPKTAAPQPAAVENTDTQTTGNRDLEKEILRDLKQACDSNDAANAARALLKLAQLQWPDQPPISLMALSVKLSDGQQQLGELDRVLYAGDDSQWQCGDLWQKFQHGLPLPAGQQVQKNEVLKPLYPKQ